MAKTSRSRPLLPSVLDRLIHGGSSSSRGRGQVLRELKESVRRDLESLLNTRQRCKPWPASCEELEVSLVNYGIPDFTGTNLGDPRSQEDFRRIVERVIESFEPRFRKVNVQLVRDEGIDRTLRFRIEGLLDAEPNPEPVSFDSILEPLTGSLEVRGGSR